MDKKKEVDIFYLGMKENVNKRKSVVDNFHTDKMKYFYVFKQSL